VSATVTGGGGGNGGQLYGGGGGGGAGIDMLTGSGLTVNAAVTGGAGGNGDTQFLGGGGGGGGGVILEDGGITAINAAVTGGRGGAGSTSVLGGSGGSGLVARASADVTISATGAITGGDGVGAGSGGAGLSLLSGGTVINAGRIAGGAGGGYTRGVTSGNSGGSGAGGASGFNQSQLTASGDGGTGIIGAGLTVINSGSIAGGNGFSGQANAITFTGGANRLELLAGSTITGNVVASGANNVLALGGASAGSFDASQIGALAQYQGFNAFEKTGASTWTLTGTTTEVTPWTLKQGTLSISSDANLGDTSGGLTFDGGTLQITGGFSLANTRAITLNAGGGTFDMGGDGSAFSQSFGGSGPVTFTNGVAVLLAANTYSGATTVTSTGILGVNAAGALSPNSDFTVDGLIVLNGFNSMIQSLSGSGIVANSSAPAPAATLTIAPTSGVTTFSGILSDGVGDELSLVKTGAGTQVLTGINNYTGATTVNGGTLSVNGSIASSSLTTVNPGGTLGGTGTVGDTLINGGTLAPGNSIGALTVAGNLVLTAASTYMVEVSPAGSDFTRVTGSATLGGATVAAQFAPGSYVEKRYTILTADGGVSGTFSRPINTNLPANFHNSLSYDANNAYLDLALNFLPGPDYGSGLNRNQQNVADALVGYFDRNGGIPAIYGALSPNGLSQASGEVATGAQQTTFDAMSQFMGLLTDPFMNQSCGARDVAGVTCSTRQGAQALSYAPTPKKQRTNAYAKLDSALIFDPHAFAQSWRVWGSGFGGSQATNGNAITGSNDTRSAIYGVAVGADYLFSPDTLAGFALAGGGTTFSVNGMGSGRSDLFQAGVYLRHTEGPAYVSAALAYGWQNITTDRAALGEALRANFNANAFAGRLEGGYRFAAGDNIGLTPYAAAQVTRLHLPGYSEQTAGGAHAFGLDYAGRTATDTRSELGLRTDKSFAVENGILTLRGRLAWAHDFNPDRATAATFQALPGASFVVNGAARASDSALVGASAETVWGNGWSVGATFDGEFSNVTVGYAGKGSIRYRW